MTTIYKSFAKLNLDLIVHAKESNNLHPISSIFKEIDLFDELTISVSPSDSPMLSLSCTGFNMPLDESNILSKIFKSLKSLISNNYTVHVEKNIPLGSGMGGASSNAATFLKALVDIEKLHWNKNKLIEFCEPFGSDIPFFFHGKHQHISGFGNILKPLSPSKPKYFYTIIYPNFHCSTKDIYNHFDKMHNENSFKLQSNEFKKNSLFEPVIDLYPYMKKTYLNLKHHVNKPVYLTGSGSTFFIPHKNIDQAKKLTLKIQNEFSDFYIKLVSDV